MNRTGVTLSLLGLLATSGLGCSAAPPSGEAPASSEVPVVELPREVREAELVAPARSAADVESLQGDWRGRYRFRRVAVGTEPTYVPYVQPSSQAAYVPYYSDYDPAYYYVQAYSAPSLGARSHVVRYGRQVRGEH
ncbi:hypothetical protein D3C72_127230 [compost metagenome]